MLPSTKIDNKKLIEDFKKRRANLISSVNFRKDALEAQKRINYQMEFERLRGSKPIHGLSTHTKNRMKHLQESARKSLQGELNSIYTTKV